MMHCRPALLICTGLGLLALAQAKCEKIGKGQTATTNGVFVNDKGEPMEVQAGAVSSSSGSWCPGCYFVQKGEVAPSAGRYWFEGSPEDGSPVEKGDKASVDGMFCPAGGGGTAACDQVCPIIRQVEQDCKNKDPKPKSEDECGLEMTDACAKTINSANSCINDKEGCAEMKKGMDSDKGTQACLAKGGTAACDKVCPIIRQVEQDCKNKDPKPESKDECGLDMTDACAKTINSANSCINDKDGCAEMKKDMDSDKGTQACLKSADAASADGAQEAKGIMVAAAALMSSLLV